MDVETAAEELVHEVLEVIICEVLTGVDNTVHVSLHQVGDNIDILVTGLCRGLCHINECNDVLMVKEFQKFDLTHDTLGINQIFERLGNFLDCDLNLGGVVISRANHTVSAVTYLLDVFKFILNNKSCS